MNELHPIERKRGFTAMTGPLSDFCSALSESVNDLQDSMVVTGVQRNGKTTAMEFIKAKAAMESSSAFFNAMTLAVDPRKRPSNDLERAFWRTFLVRSLEDQRLNFESNYHALLTAIRAACDRRETRRVIICLDDAQKLTAALFYYLKQLDEQLITEGYETFFLLIAQPDMRLRMHQLEVDTQHEYIDRFLTNYYRFRGNNRSDVESFLEHYDKATWPLGSGITYTQHYAPKLWNAGWRFKDEADALWSAFATLAQRLGLSVDDLEVGTKFLVAACKAILVALGNGRIASPTHLAWGAAAEKSGFFMTRQIVGNPEEEAQKALEELLQLEREARLRRLRRSAKNA